VRLFLPLVLFALATPALANRPVLLIVQYKVDVTSKDDPNVSIANLLAEQLDVDGRVDPIVWSLSDARFRKASESGLLGDYTPNPTPAELDFVAKKLRAEYLLVTTARRDGGTLDAAAQLHKGSFGKPIWSDKQPLGVAGPHGVDWDNAAQSISNTWAVQLAGGPFKRLKAQPRLNPPDGSSASPPDPGTTNVAPSIPDPVRTSSELISKGLFAEAISVLRMGIDDDPFEPKRREALVRLLLDQGLYREAGSEARRSIALTPGNAVLRLLAARAWLRLHDLEEAQKELNEALARDVQDPIVQLLLGELAIERNEPSKAVEPYQKALERADSFEARLGLGLSFALLGNVRGAADSFNNLPTTSAQSIEDGYERSVRALDRAIDELVTEFRSLMQRAQLKQGDAEIIEKTQALLQLAQSMSAFVAAVPSPLRHRPSHERRDLAHKLLVQSLEQALEFAKTADEDASGEALLSMSETLKQFTALRTLYGYEKIPSSAGSG